MQSHVISSSFGFPGDRLEIAYERRAYIQITLCPWKRRIYECGAIGMGGFGAGKG